MTPANPCTHGDDRGAIGGIEHTADGTEDPATQHDRGAIGGIEVVPLSMLVFVVGMLLGANAWATVNASTSVDAAAREGVRAFVEADDSALAHAAATAAIEGALSARGTNNGSGRIESIVITGGDFSRCARVEITVAYDVNWQALPFVGGRRQLMTVRGSHSELIDPFRSGVAGDATC